MSWKYWALIGVGGYLTIFGLYVLICLYWPWKNDQNDEE